MLTNDNSSSGTDTGTPTARQPKARPPEGQSPTARPPAARPPAKRPPLHVRLERSVRRRPLLADLVLMSLPIGFLSVVFSLPSAGVDTTGQEFVVAPLWLVLALDVIISASLCLRRVRPEWCAAIMAGAALLQVLTMAGPGFSAVAVPIAVYSCAKYGTRSGSRLTLAAALVGSLLLGAYYVLQVLPYSTGPDRPSADPFEILVLAVPTVLAAVIVLTAWLFGDIGGRRRREVSAVAERNALLERERVNEARLAADAERMRIAREMHDVVSHSMSVMIAQADGGRYVVADDPEAAAGAFAAIGSTGREALSQMRSMLGVLRENGPQAPISPQPGLEDLAQLVADVRAAGIAVSLHGDPAGLPEVPAGVGLAAYRIVQEALTNSLKHAGTGTRASVSVAITGANPRVLRVRIDDTGPTGPGTHSANGSPGSGIVGMRERATIHGGDLEAAGDADGYHVTARFPLEDDDPR